MINQGILAVDFSDASRLKITPLSHQVLKDEFSPELAKYIDQAKVKAAPKTKSKPVPQDYNEELFEKLRSWRYKLAKEKNVPPYIIFGDRTLKAISAEIPQNNMELLNVDGIGKKKLEQYGLEVLEMCYEFK
jgi:ATP-dependent DNA helicase RecQ